MNSISTIGVIKVKDKYNITYSLCEKQQQIVTEHGRSAERRPCSAASCRYRN